MKIGYLSHNLVTIIKQMLGILTPDSELNQQLAKYLFYNNVDNPLSQPDLSRSDIRKLIMNKVFPFPFDGITETDGVNIRVYYPRGDFDTKEVISESIVSFDIVCSKNLWLVNDGKSEIRPYQMMNYIMDRFSGKSIDRVGRLEFLSFEHVMINEDYSGVRIVSEMTLFDGG